MNAPAKNITESKPAFSKEKVRETKKAIKRFGAHLATGGEGLWDHQSKAMASVGAFLSASLETVSNGESVSGAIVMPTGAGKTVVAAEVTKGLGTRALILAPTIKIVQQHKEELEERVPTLDAAIYSSKKGLDSEVVVMTYHAAVSLMKKGALPGDFGVVFYDEAHRSLSFERSKLHGSVSQLEIGLTATPIYDEVKHIWTVFDHNIFDMDLPEAVEAGVLSPLRGYIVPTSVDVRDIKLKQGEDSIDGVKAEKFLNVMARNMAAKRFYVEKFKGTPTVVFCVSKRHAEHFADYMRAAGVKAAHIHGGMSAEKRDEVLDAFESGKLDMLTSVDVLIEGWDSKRVELAMNLRPTYSRVVKAHMVGRVMRAREGKEAGIFAEFQDMYGHGQQPILVHHLMERAEFRQGGLVAAPQGKMASEETRLKSGKNVTVTGKVKVGFKVKPVVRLEKVGSEYDLRDPKVLEEILESRPDIDWENAPASQLKDVTVDHPAFTGNIITLMHKVFGIPNRVGSKLRNADDVRTFLWYAIEDRMIAADERRLEVAASFDGGTSSRNPVYGRGESVSRFKELSVRTREALETLTPREQKVLKMRFGDGMDLEEVGKEFWITRDRARQFEAKALRKLRHPTRSRLLREFIERDPPQEFNGEHSHRYEFVKRDDYVVRLERSYYEFKSWQRPPVKLNAALKKSLENGLETLFQSLHRFRLPSDVKSILEKAGFPRLAQRSPGEAEVLSYLNQEFEKVTGHRIRISFGEGGTFREIGKEF